MSSGQDPYMILGVPASASQKEIRNAYRKLAMKFHPDKNPGDRSAEEIFKKVCQAYAVVGDPKARMQYDASPPNMSAGSMFTAMFPQAEVTLAKAKDMFFQFIKSQDMSRNVQKETMREGDLVVELDVGLDELYKGCMKEIPRTAGIKVAIKPGLRNGHRIRLPGKGDVVGDGSSRGDMLIVLKEKAHAVFRRRHNNLHMVHTLALEDALCGCEFSIRTLDGRSVLVKLDRLQDTQYIHIISGEGMPEFNPADPDMPLMRGDLHVHFRVVFPDRHYSADQREYLRLMLGSSEIDTLSEDLRDKIETKFGINPDGDTLWHLLASTGLKQALRYTRDLVAAVPPAAKL